MKHLMTLALSLITASTSFAAINHKKYHRAVNEITALEKAGQLKLAALTAAMSAQTIADNGKFDQIVASLNTTLQENRQEVVTNTVNREAGFGLFFGLLSGSAQQNYDVARILTTNPKTVARFTSVKERNFSRLQSSLKSHVTKNETELFYAKALAAKSLQIASAIPLEDLQGIYSFVTKTAQRVSQVSFLGLQNITSCLRVDYAQRSAGWSVGLEGILAFNASETEVQNPYRETTCERSVVTTSESEFALRSAETMLVDQALQLSMSRLSLKMFSEAEAPVYPTWGSTYIHP